MDSGRRNVLKGLAAAAAATGAARLTTRPASASPAFLQRSPLDEVWPASIVIDNMAYPWRNPALPDPDPAIDYAMLDEAGATVVSSTLGGASLNPDLRFRDSVVDLARVAARAERHSRRLMMIRRFGDVAVAKQQGKLGILANFQDSTAVGADLTRLDTLYELGVRQIQLTYNARNLMGDGCMERAQGGLSHLGIELVGRLNALGILVDVAHSGERTTLDAIEASKKPILFSHANCKAVYDHPRNKTDEQIKALARRGGVMGMTLLSWFNGGKGPRTTLDDLLDHFDHAMRLVGPDHVAFGSDMGLPGWPVADPDPVWQVVRNSYNDRDWEIAKPRYPPYIEEVNNARRYRTIAEGLLKRGYSLADVQKVLGLNVLRVYKEVLQP